MIIINCNNIEYKIILLKNVTQFINKIFVFLYKYGGKG